jgi:hypothetical protein
MLEDVVEEAIAADRPDRRKQAEREPVVVRREEILGGVGDVVHVPRPPDAVPYSPATDQARSLERV